MACALILAVDSFNSAIKNIRSVYNNCNSANDCSECENDENFKKCNKICFCCNVENQCKAQL